jgi:hypothetical protein
VVHRIGVHRVGFSWHWKEELAKLEENLEKLRKLRSEDSLGANRRQSLLRRANGFSTTPSFSIRVERAAMATPGQDLTVTAAVESESPLETVRLRYRHLTQFEDYETVEMTLDSTTGKYPGIIPGSFIVSSWNLIYFVEALPENGNGRLAPDLEQEMPYVIVPVERVVED